MNSDFGGRKKPRGPWRAYNLKNAEGRGIQQRFIDVYKRGELTGSDVDFVNRYVSSELTIGDERRSFATLRNISMPGSDVVTAFVNVANKGLFWRLRRCEYPSCSKFFLPRPKQLYCSTDCLRLSNSDSAQQRVEKSRKAARFKAIEKQLKRIRELGERKGVVLAELMDRIPGFDPRLLSEIAEGKEDLRVVAEKVKYKNFKILKEAKL